MRSGRLGDVYEGQFNALVGLVSKASTRKANAQQVNDFLRDKRAA